jgi:membrane-bound lytic murein transglycosylase B
VTSPRRLVLLLAGVLLLGSLPVAPARAESAAQAKQAAQRAAADVAALQPRVDRAMRAYEKALGQLAHSVTKSVSADVDADAALRQAATARRTYNGRVRALYMAGGSAALYASILDASSVADAMRRVAYVQRIVQVGETNAADSRSASTTLLARAGALDTDAEAAVVTAAEVAQRYDELQALLAQSADTLSRLSARAKKLARAEAAAARLRALSASIALSAAERVATARAIAIPKDFRPIYMAAARTCKGLPWSVLAAIGQVETGHGRNTAVSYAGAQGPMQFMPATFAAYGVDGDGDGFADINNPVDAIFSAARYLCANGGGRGPTALARAIWHYNHADWYVALVLKIAGQLAAKP